MAMAKRRYQIIIFHQKKGEIIDRQLVYDLQYQLDKVVTTEKNNTEFDILIDSPGGDPHAAYKLWLELRERAIKLRAWIPDFAKSSATLLVMGVDEIYMSISAELGPLDVQIEHPDRENITISALDVVNALDYFSQSAVDIAIIAGANLIEITKLPRLEIVKEVLPFAARVIQPCIEKIDPHLTHRAANQLKITEHYARRMLILRNPPQDKKLSGKKAKALIDYLVKKYPAHQCVIGRDEALALGLPVYNSETQPEWPAIKGIYSQYMKDKGAILTVIPPPNNNNTRTKKKKKVKKKKSKRGGA